MGNGMGESKGAKTRGVLIRRKKKKGHTCVSGHTLHARKFVPPYAASQLLSIDCKSRLDPIWFVW